MQIFVENLTSRNREEGVKAAWFSLPVKMDYLTQKLALHEGDEYTITDFDGPAFIGEQESILKLNRWAEVLNSVPKEWVKHADDLIGDLFSGVDDFLENWETASLLTEVTNDREYGEYLTSEGGIMVPSELKHYIDHEALGRDRRTNEMIVYTDSGAFYK